MSRNDGVDIAGVGSIRMVRTLRVGADGALYPANSATAWIAGWNTATCGRWRDNPPDADCRCGFYGSRQPAG